MKPNYKIILLFALLAFALTMQSCYTEVVLPKHTVKKTKVDKDRIVNFTYSVIDTFDFDWMPDDGYYYEFRFDNKGIKEDKIDAFLNMLYAKGYNIIGAWYRPGGPDCSRDGWVWNHTIKPLFVVLLTESDDSISEYNLYPLFGKRYFECPYNVWEFWIE
jgi:hypothetical protein